jgi:hypothetical protein
MSDALSPAITLREFENGHWYFDFSSPLAMKVLTNKLAPSKKSTCPPSGQTADAKM